MIIIKNVNKKFKKHKVFEDLNLFIKEKELTFVVGKSGLGKTTLLHLIAGFEKPDSGEIFLKRSNENKSNLIDKCDLIFQDFNLIENLNALENLRFGLETLGLKVDENNIFNLAKELNIDNETLLTKAKNLSGGEKQRIAILRSLLRNKEILLVDEPTANLDKENKEIIFKLLKTVSKNKTVIVVSHDIEKATKYADNIYDLEAHKYSTLVNFQDKKEYSTSTVDSIEIQSDSLWKFKWRSIFTILKSDFKKRIWQYLLIFISLFSSVVIIGNTHNLFNNNLIAAKENKKDLNYDLIEVKKEVPGISFNFNPNETNSIISNETNTEEISLSYSLNLNDKFILLQNNDKSFSLSEENTLQVKISDFSKNRFIGEKNNFIENKNEIILSKKAAEALNVESSINSVVKLKLINLDFQEETFEKELKVVDINTKLDANERNLNYVSSELILEIQKWVSRNKTWKTSVLRDKNTSNNSLLDHELILENSIEDIKNKENFKLIYGSFPTKIEELLISNKLLETLGINWESDSLVLKDGVNNYVFKITGVYEDEKLEVFTTSENINYLNSVSPNKINIYSNDTREIKKNFENKNLYVIYSYKNSLIESFISQNRYTNSLLIYIAIGIVIVSILIFLVVSKFVNDSKVKEIGIYKVLGSKTWQIFIYYIGSLIPFVLISFVLVLSLCYPIQLIFASFLHSNNLIVFSFWDNLPIYLISWLIFNLVILTFNFLWFLVLNKKSKTKLLKEDNV